MNTYKNYITYMQLYYIKAYKFTFMSTLTVSSKTTTIQPSVISVLLLLNQVL